MAVLPGCVTEQQLLSMAQNLASTVQMVHKLMLYWQHYGLRLLNQSAVCFFVSLPYHEKRNEQRSFSVV
jgi:hypothetical protein